MILGKRRRSMLAHRRPRRELAPHERGLQLGQHRAAIATIKHDLKVGNLEHARAIAGRIIEGDMSQMTPAMLHTAIASIEVALDEAGL